MTRHAHRLTTTLLATTLLVATLGVGCSSDPTADAATDAAAADAGTTDAGTTTADGATTADGTTAADDIATTDGTGTDANCTPWTGKGAPLTLGGKRPAKVVLPKDWKSCAKPPLVILLHGFSASGTIQDIYLGLSARVDSHGFALVIPEGTMNQDKKQFWNATNACCDFYKQGVDDVAYLRSLITEATDKLGTDPARVSLVGHSNGGFMAFRMACEASDLVTGIVSIAGSVVATASQCAPKRPVNVLHIHGTNDKTILFTGGQFGGNTYPAAQTTYDRWAKLNTCSDKATQGAAVDYDAAPDGPETTSTTLSGCNGDVEVGLWTMKGSGHIPGFNPAFKDVLATKVSTWTRAAK